MRDHVGDDFFGVHVDHGRADRNADDRVFALLAGHLPAHAVLAALRPEHALMAKIDQRVQPFTGEQPHASAIATVHAVSGGRATLGRCRGR